MATAIHESLSSCGNVPTPHADRQHQLPVQSAAVRQEADLCRGDRMVRRARILRIGMQAVSVLAAAHAQVLVHRDVKLASDLLENGVERVKLRRCSTLPVAKKSRHSRDRTKSIAWPSAPMANG